MTADLSNASNIGKYATVNGMKMYYEIYGTGFPLVLIHGGGSTINTSFASILPSISNARQVIAVEMQAHGHTSDRDMPETFEQDADDVAELLRQLGITVSDIFGFSNGGHTAIEIAIRHPQIVRRLVLASTFYSREGVPATFWNGFENPDFDDMPQVYKDEFLKVNNDQQALRNMFSKDVQRMHSFAGWEKEVIASIEAPTLIVAGDQDLPLPEHLVEMYRLLPQGRLAILPGGHGSYMGEAMYAATNSNMPDLFVAMVEEFLTR